MSDISPGDFIECIEVDQAEGCFVSIGDRFICADVRKVRTQCTVHGAHCRGFGLVLDGKSSPPGFYWCSACFRKLDHPTRDWMAWARADVPAQVDLDRIRKALIGER